MFKQKKHLNYLKKTLELAEHSVQNGNHPFGAILVLDGKVIVSSENQVISFNDVTAHAELLLVQQSQKFLNAQELSRSVLYTSTEPCAMCAGAIYWSGISKVVYGCSANELFKIVKCGLNMKAEMIFKKGSRPIEIIGYPQEQIFKDIHLQFWISY